eukprot:scaffold46429_cov44-Phaeocystis_antarctica.AAC.1
MLRYDCGGAAGAAVLAVAPGSHVASISSSAVRKLREDSFAWWWRCGEYVVHRRVPRTFGCLGYGSTAELGANGERPLL